MKRRAEQWQTVLVVAVACVTTWGAMRNIVGGAVVVAALWLALAGVQAQGAPAPILVVLNSAAPNQYGGYLPEILRAEGLTSFDVVALSSLNAPTLASASLVVLADTPLTAGQASLLTTYVTSGGRLVAMRPDPQVAGVFGITAAAGTTVNGYTLIDQSGPGAGLQAMTLPYKGEARHYTLAGATTVAALYDTRTTASGFPAVVRHNRTAAWSFDLARSTAYVRQGDPAFAGVERDGKPLLRTTDVFFQTIDLERLGVPHADVQMRLLSRVIIDLLADAQPLPRLWYFPGTARSMLIPTGYSHVETPSSYASLIATLESVGARMTIFLARFLNLSASPIASWAANGHEFAVHPVFADDGISGNFAQGYTNGFTWFQGAVPVAPAPTVRHHTLEWSGWTGPVTVMDSFGIGLDLSYSPFGPAVHQPNQQSQAHGFINGSGLPMRFIDAAGQVLPVFQQSTTLADEQLVAGLDSEGLSVAAALAVSRAIIDDSLAGGHSAIATQFHVDYYPNHDVKPWVDGTLAYAASQGMPMWPSARWLRFVETRAATTITNQMWNSGGGLMTFDVTVPAGGPPQSLMLPAAFGPRVLSQVRVDGQTVVPTALTVHGRLSQVVQITAAGGTPREVTIRYSLPSSLPTVSVAAGSVIEGNSGTSTGSVTVALSAPAATDVAVSFTTSNGSAAAGSDYLAVADGAVVIPAGALSRPATINVIGDTNYEADETAIVTLANPIGATLGTASAALTIVNDEPIVAVADSFATSYVTPLAVAAPGVLANDNANGSPTLTAVLISSTANGSLTFSANGAFSYTPDPWFAGPDTFTYRGDTAAGTGNIVTVTVDVAQPTTVQPPRELRVWSMVGNVVTFRWRPPGVGPAPVGYQLEGGATPGAADVGVATPSAPIFTVPAPTGSFYVRLRTLGVGGPSPVSNEIRIHVGVPVPPSPPVGLQATSVGDAVHLAWTPTFGGGAAAGYVLDVTGSLVASLPLPAVERVSFAGAPGGSYALALRAVNGGGSSGQGAPVPLVVPGACAGSPGVPTHVLAYTAGGTTFLVWEPPTSGPAPISYLISVPGVGSLPSATRAVSGPLPPGTYTINVMSVGPCGVSAPATQVLTVP
jgi:hypothetical protein